MKYKPSQIRKFIVAVIGALVTLIVSLGSEFAQWFPPNVSAVIVTVASVLTAIGVYLTKNAPVIDSADRYLQ